MTEVHRYQVVTMLSAAGATIGFDPHGPEVVMASAFDEATRLFLDAAERCVASERREKELQQRLTAADERADTATSLIQRIVANFDTEIEFDEDVEPNDLEHDQVLAEMRVFLGTGNGAPAEGGDE